MQDAGTIEELDVVLKHKHARPVTLHRMKTQCEKLPLLKVTGKFKI